MANQFKFLSEEEQEDIVVQTYAGFEFDKYTHTINLERFDKILAKLTTEQLEAEIKLMQQTEMARENIRRQNPKAALPPFTPMGFIILQRRDTILRMGEVDTYMEVTEPQLPKGERLTQAKKRLLDRKAKQA